MSAAKKSTAIVVDGHEIRRDGDMWCLTDLWRAAGAPKEKRPSDYLSGAGKAFVEFLSDSLDAAKTGITKARKIPGGGGETWGHWQIALAYAKALSHPFHARVNEVYRAYVAGELAPRIDTAAEAELVRLSLRIRALDRAPGESDWDLELKLELARLRKIKWLGAGLEPKPLAFAYGRTWRIILGDAVYAELKARNPHPKSGSLHGQWLAEERQKIAKREDLVVALVLARRSSRWYEYEAEMRAHFRRAMVQLRLLPGGGR